MTGNTWHCTLLTLAVQKCDGCTKVILIGAQRLSCGSQRLSCGAQGYPAVHNGYPGQTWVGAIDTCKVPGEVNGKIMLEKVPGKLLRKLNVGKSAWRAALQTTGRVIDKVFRGHNVTRRQCRLQLGTAINLVSQIS